MPQPQLTRGPIQNVAFFVIIFCRFLFLPRSLLRGLGRPRFRHFLDPIVRDPSGRTRGPHISLDPYDHHIVMVRAHHGGTQVRPQMGTQFFMEGPNWDPISVTRDPIVDPNVAPIGDPIWDPIVFCGQLRTKSFVRECGVGWGGLFGGVAADVNCDEFHVIWVHNWVPPKQFGSQFGPSKQNWVPLRRALTMTR